MPTLTDLFNIHLRELDLALAESELLLQKEGGLDGELKTSGSLCERFMRSTLTKYVIPGQYRVSSGYVATPALLSAGKNLPQCDILIADNWLPALLRLAESSIEVLPQEAIIGVLEAKRTLTKKSLGHALDHLSAIVESIDRSADLKTDQDLNGANKYEIVHNHSSNKPLLGVVAMKCDIPNFAEEVKAMILDRDSLVDFVWTMDGSALVPGFQSAASGLLYYTHSARPTTKTWMKLSADDFSGANSPFYRQFSGLPVWASITSEQGISREVVFARMIGLLSLTISRIFPGRIREEQINDYYLRAT
jgi:hypothetical protein